MVDCLNGARWFSFLNLKLGYWQVELDEESNPLTAIMVGLLGLYQCGHMPFVLTNTPTAFQCLNGNHLRDLHLNWCIIYLDDIIISPRLLESTYKGLEVYLKNYQQQD